MPWTQVREEDKKVYDYGSNGVDSRIINYVDSIRETLTQAMERDDRIYIMGQGVNDRVGMFGMTNGLSERFGTERCFDTPIAETGLTGIAVGSAMAGRHPVYMHNRPDFLLLAMDQLVNHASKYSYMSAGQYKVPLLVIATTGQGWGSAAQHTQALHALFMHIPGVKIIMPTTPYDVKGLLASALEDQNPVIFLDHRRIHNQEGAVPEDLYKIPFGSGMIRRVGSDITLLGISAMLIECMDAADMLEQNGISAEVIDPRTMKPFDYELVIQSVKKTGHLIIADTSWKTGGVSAEIAANIYERCFPFLKRPIERVSLPDVPTPAGYNLESAFYVNAKKIFEIANKFLNEL